MYRVKVKQEIPYTHEEDGEIIYDGTTGETEEYTAGTFTSLGMAKLFQNALQNDISEAQGRVWTIFTPMVYISEVKQTIVETEIE